MNPYSQEFKNIFQENSFSTDLLSVNFIDLLINESNPKNSASSLEKDYSQSVELLSNRLLSSGWQVQEGGFRQVFVSANHDFVVKTATVNTGCLQQSIFCQFLEFFRAHDLKTKAVMSELELNLPKTELGFYQATSNQVPLAIVLMEKVEPRGATYPFLDLNQEDLSEEAFLIYLDYKFQSLKDSQQEASALKIQEFELLKECSIQYGTNSFKQKTLYDLGGYGEIIEFYFLENSCLFQNQAFSVLKKSMNLALKNFDQSKIKRFEYISS